MTCNAVCPGWVRTPLVEKQISDITDRHISQKEATNELLREKQPSLDFVSPAQPRATRLHGGILVLGRGRSDHRHHNLDRWRLDRTIAPSWRTQAWPASGL